jgi:hydrogenase-4 component F
MQLTDPVFLILGVPAAAAIVLAAIPGYRITATLNVVASGLTFIVALRLFI